MHRQRLIAIFSALPLAAAPLALGATATQATEGATTAPLAPPALATLAVDQTPADQTPAEERPSAESPAPTAPISSPAVDLPTPSPVPSETLPSVVPSPAPQPTLQPAPSPTSIEGEFVEDPQPSPEASETQLAPGPSPSLAPTDLATAAHIPPPVQTSADPDAPVTGIPEAGTPSQLSSVSGLPETSGNGEVITPPAASPARTYADSQILGTQVPRGGDADRSGLDAVPLEGSVVGSFYRSNQGPYEGAQEWVEGYLNAQQNPAHQESSTADTHRAAGVLGADQQGSRLTAPSNGTVFERGTVIMSSSLPMCIFTLIGLSGLAAILIHFMWPYRSRKP